MSVDVRDAASVDLSRVAQIKVANWSDTYAPLVPTEVLTPYLDQAVQAAHLREDLDRPSTLFLVAEDDVGLVIGFSLTYVDADPEPWLESLHVPRELRSRGAGSALVRATAKRLVAAGLRFYEHLGAQHTGQEPAEWAPSVQHEIYRWADLSLIQR